jgi:hypothetical protein
MFRKVTVSIILEDANGKRLPCKESLDRDWSPSKAADDCDAKNAPIKGFTSTVSES